MVVYNVTVSIEKSVVEEWKKWMKDEHIPDVLATGLFSSARFLKMLSEVEGNPGETYAIQYNCESMDHLTLYQEKYAAVLQKDHSDRFGGKYHAFRTVLEDVD
ncbi:DUF4286 family protein [Sediminitomix flava]|uniref:Uncharacterized protein DUF4286 n=1 Tax=Sediminitomix flava TaxID=379075 RepID=A0A315Z2U5_SEDFL|nr:DUF4286 family protein [Sediminitomix flava]PWJ36116.1 uncharacterized protein DUF4286 [Sediminitomix flava]